MLVLAVIVLSLFAGCAVFSKKLPAPCGVTDYIETKEGDVINGVSLPTDENKTYNVVLPKVGAWFSQECYERIN
jgi:hypothetical protein